MTRAAVQDTALPSWCGRSGVLATSQRRRVPRSSCEVGSATVWVLAAVAVVLAVGLTAMSVGSAVLARHRAEAAADLAALAGAGQLATGESDGCARAAHIAVANGARLDSCSTAGSDVLVRVSCSPPGLPARFGRAQARARAGPVDRTSPGPRTDRGDGGR